MPTWLVTGTSRGIGLELVRQLAADSRNTVFASCRKPDTASTLNELAKSHTNLHVVALDVDDESSARAAAEAVKTILPAGAGVDYLINNSGWVRRVLLLVPRVGSAFPSYSIAKTSLNMLTRKIAKQYPDFIVFAFAPGWIKTEMGGSGAEYEVDDAVKRHIKIYETVTLEKHTDKFINQFEEPVAW